MENNFNVDNLSTFGIYKLKQINETEAEIIRLAKQVGENNRNEVYDQQLIERFIELKNELNILTYNFLY